MFTRPSTCMKSHSCAFNAGRSLRASIMSITDLCTGPLMGRRMQPGVDGQDPGKRPVVR